MTTTTQRLPYLTIQEVADELGCQKRNVYKLIENRKLPALKLSERNTVVSRWALEAYQRRINGQPALISEIPAGDDAMLTARFIEESGGLTPQQFYKRFKAGQIEDTSANMTLLVKAIALGAGGDQAEAPVKHETWAVAALTSLPTGWPDSA